MNRLLRVVERHSLFSVAFGELFIDLSLRLPQSFSSIWETAFVSLKGKSHSLAERTKKLMHCQRIGILAL